MCLGKVNLQKIKSKGVFIFKDRKESSFFFVFVIANLVVDQWSKIKAEAALMLWQDPENLKLYQGDFVPLGHLGNVMDADHNYLSLALNYVRNQGAAWGFLSDLNDKIRVPLFYGITFFAVLMILKFIKDMPHHYRLGRFALFLIFSGALGNLADRILLGYVIDFIAVQWSVPLPFLGRWSYEFPRFNWADSTISVGVTLLLIHMIFFEENKKT
jgi:signal peptidase II